MGEERDRQLYMNSNRKRRDMMSDLTDFVQPQKRNEPMTRILIFAVYRQKNKLIWGIYVDLLVSRTFVQDGTIYLGAVGVW